jgi:hypothetical protein
MKQIDIIMVVSQNSNWGKLLYNYMTNFLIKSSQDKIIKKKRNKLYKSNK